MRERSPEGLRPHKIKKKKTIAMVGSAQTGVFPAGHVAGVPGHRPGALQDREVLGHVAALRDGDSP